LETRSENTLSYFAKIRFHGRLYFNQKHESKNNHKSFDEEEYVYVVRQLNEMSNEIEHEIKISIQKELPINIKVQAEIVSDL